MITERCRIRQFKPKDIEAFISYRNDMNWMQYQMFKGLTRKEYENFLLKHHFPEDGIQLAVVDRYTDKLLGDVYIRRQNHSFWIGYTIHPTYAQQGFMREVVFSLVRILLRCPGCHEILAGAVKENLRSKNLLEKIGFRLCYYDEETQEDVYRLEKGCL
ncbi:MAG: N-acetyltransferase [Clostridia bacterium]|nr:N-acetyltransferase [Clostridia bacterium]